MHLTAAELHPERAFYRVGLLIARILKLSTVQWFYRSHPMMSLKKEKRINELNVKTKSFNQTQITI